MKSGIELIAEERKEQIEKHGYDLNHDIEKYDNGELLIAAKATIEGNDWEFPADWDLVSVQKICDKPFIQRLAIAGAFIAAEMDRIIALESENLTV